MPRSLRAGSPPAFPSGGRRLPLALLLASLVFAGLFLAGATLDLRRLETALTGVLEDEAIGLAESVEQVATERLTNLLRADAEPSLAGAPFSEESYAGQEALAAALLDAARTAMSQFKPDTSSASLRSLAESWHLAAVVVLDPSGRVLRESRPVPREQTARLRQALVGQGEIAFDFSRSLAEEEFVGYLALRKPGLPGVALLVDRAGLRHWASRLAIQEAVGALGGRRGVAYAVVADARGRAIAQLGEPPAPPIVPAARRRLAAGGSEVLEVAVSLRVAEEVAGTLRVGLDAGTLNRLLRQSRSRSYQTAGLMLGIGVLAVVALFAAQGRYHRRLHAFGERLQQAERLSALGKLAAGLAHEIRNPLNAIGLAAQRIQREHPGAGDDGGEALGRLTGVIRDEVRRLNRLIEDFLRLSPTGPPKLEPRALEPFLRELLALVDVEAKARGVALELSFTATQCIVRLDADRLKQALLNLLRNALDAIPEGEGRGAVRVRLEPRGASTVAVSIEDTGVGIPPENLERVFDPDFTTKERGLGLGLPMAYEIVRAHGGRLEVRSEPGKGTTFEIVFPCESHG